MQKIVPHFWYDQAAGEAAEFYTSLFEDSSIDSKVEIYDTPSGTAETVTFTLAGQSFMSISAGPIFQFTPAVSLQVICSTIAEVDHLWKELSSEGSVLMQLDAYPFSERYGWTEDKYGLSWQILYVPDQLISQKITPTLLFTDKQYGNAKEAMEFYTSVFANGAIDGLNYYSESDENSQVGTVQYGLFNLEGQNFVAMDSGMAHGFTFNEAVSFVVNCDTQEEIDYYWDKLSFVPEAEQCGWLKDKYGLSWQIVPTRMKELMTTKDSEKLQRVTQAFLKMKKFNLAELDKAYKG